MLLLGYNHIPGVFFFCTKMPDTWLEVDTDTGGTYERYFFAGLLRE